VFPNQEHTFIDEESPPGIKNCLSMPKHWPHNEQHIETRLFFGITCSSVQRISEKHSVSLRNTACIITLSNRLEYFPLGILILSRMNKHEQNLKPPPSSSNYSNDAESHCRDVDHKEKYKTSMNLLDEWPRLARPRPTESEFEQAVQAPKSSTIPLPNPDPVINTWLAPQLHTLKCNQSHLH